MSLVFLIIFTIIFLFLVEILCILFKLTGLQDYKARFQVISILTGTGYTTKESELIVQHKGRRKLAQWTMILGYIGLATFIPFFMTFIAEFIIDELKIKAIILLGIFLFLLIAVIRNKRIIMWLDKKIEYILLNNKIKHNHKHLWTLISRSHGFGIYNILVDKDCKIIGKTLLESKLSEEEIILLNVDRGNAFFSFPKADFILEEDDNIVIYGKVENIKKIFKI
ncbi:MAG: TrkA C-terminal domain-containing protein [Sarcina sp.]